MKSIAARYDGGLPSASDPRALYADCSCTSVGVLTAFVSFRSFALGQLIGLFMPQFDFELRKYGVP